MTVYYYTFGCKVNQYETDCIKEQMERLGHAETGDLSSSDAVIINTCTVTGSADIKLRQLINKARRTRPEAIIAVMGCYSQAYGATEILAGADIIVGENNKTRLPEMIQSFQESRARLISIEQHTKQEKIEEMSLSRRPGKTRAIIRIQDGCDRFCSYCIIPYARGRARSKPLAEIEKEAKTLADAGHMELVLVGINLSCYGQDLGENITIADAVHTVCRASCAKRVRLGSIEPEMLTDEIIERLAGEEKLCPHFHLSLQSGCNKTLKEMRRKYTKEDYSALVSKFRDCFKDCAITTDVMVGFAGESEEDFRESLEFVKSMGFAKVHVFPYSEREGTLAAKRTDQVPKAERGRRAELMAEAAKEGEKASLQGLVGRKVSVLFERERDELWHQGHTESYVLVKVPRGDGSLWKEISEVEILSAEDGYCVGKFILPWKP